jgi:alkanesulfonate monooxygenase SsuD/methylene tetrahydromethanopterin reductase-like flavin-dependent oxidoreductase (luciferase family)
MREYTINAIVAAEPLHYHGKLFQLDRGFTMRDHQPTADRRHIPIHVASLTPKSIEQTAQLADGWIPVFVPRSQWAAQVQIAHDALRAAGRDPSTFDIRAGGSVSVTSDPERAYQHRENAVYIAHGRLLLRALPAHRPGRRANAVRAAWQGAAQRRRQAVPDDLARRLGRGPIGGCV